MKRPAFLLSFLFVPLSVFCLEKPNILWICIEDTGPFLNCYGWDDVVSPEIDTFSEQAVLFEDVHCNVALCTPSRTSVLTGIRPSTSQIVKIDDDWKAMLPKAVSLPKHFRDHGYYTEAIGKIYDGRSGGLEPGALDVDDPHRLTTNGKALEAVERAAGQDQPFLLMIGYFQAHLPWEPTEWAKAQYAVESIDTTHMLPSFKGKALTALGLKEMIRDFYATITDVDRLVGETLARAEALGLMDDTIILVGVMDHGYSLGWHGKYGKGNNYDMETMVPLLVRIPGMDTGGRRASGLVELVDLFPTLVDLCGLPEPPQQLEGLSFRPLLEDPDRAWKKAAITHNAYHVNNLGVKTKQWNLISWVGRPLELYDRLADPLNLNNVADQHPEVVAELREFMNLGWRTALPEGVAVRGGEQR